MCPYSLNECTCRQHIIVIFEKSIQPLHVFWWKSLVYLYLRYFWLVRNYSCQFVNCFFCFVHSSFLSSSLVSLCDLVILCNIQFLFFSLFHLCICYRFLFCDYHVTYIKILMVMTDYFSSDNNLASVAYRYSRLLLPHTQFIVLLSFTCFCIVLSLIKYCT